MNTNTWVKNNIRIDNRDKNVVSKNIINVGKILIDSKEDNLVVVFSAIAKVTNMFEKVIGNYFQGDKIYLSQLQEIKLLHANIVSDLFNNNELIFQELDNIFLEISLILSQDITFDFSYYYELRLDLQSKSNRLSGPRSRSTISSVRRV